MDKPLKETVPRKNGRLTAKEATSRLPVGRPKGAKNKTTIFKEVMRNGFEEEMEREGIAVIKSVISAAKGSPLVDKEGNAVLDDYGKAVLGKGDMQAAKLLLDRILPTTKAIDLDQLENSKGLTISINVGELTGHPDLVDIDGDVIEGN